MIYIAISIILFNVLVVFFKLFEKYNIDNLHGSSSYFRGGIIAYNDEIKVNILDINKDTIIKESSRSPFF